MQIKHYTILEHADLAVIRAWADNPDNRCYVIAQGRVDQVTHSLCVHQPSGMTGVFELTESAFTGMIVETAWPE
jgi:hypothetical protein